MSGYLAEHAKPGDRVEFTGPMGSFFLRAVNRPALLLAGGTGLAPLLSMLEQMSAEPPEHPVHLLYGVTTDEDLVHMDDLERYAASIPNFTFDYCVADEASSAPNKGFVTALIDSSTLHDGDVDVYLCGPPPMVEAVRGHIDGLGVTPASFHYEKFTPGAAGDAR
jgi:benzoate/toluate 1,2-dioxygenase reductase component